MDNATLARRFMEGFIGAGDMGVADEFVAPDVTVTTGLSPQGPIRGREAYKGAIALLHRDFEMTHFAVEDLLEAADGERVALRIRSVGAHRGGEMGLPATGQTITFIETHVIRVQNGQVVENVVSATNLEFEMLFADVLRPQVLPQIYGK